LTGNIVMAFITAPANLKVRTSLIADAVLPF
jgi:hypothetical protein